MDRMDYQRDYLSMYAKDYRNVLFSFVKNIEFLCIASDTSFLESDRFLRKVWMVANSLHHSSKIQETYNMTFNSFQFSSKLSIFLLKAHYRQ